jgi:hypothetical protein
VTSWSAIFKHLVLRLKAETLARAIKFVAVDLPADAPQREAWRTLLEGWSSVAEEVMQTRVRADEVIALQEAMKEAWETYPLPGDPAPSRTDVGAAPEVVQPTSLMARAARSPRPKK